MGALPIKRLGQSAYVLHPPAQQRQAGRRRQAHAQGNGQTAAEDLGSDAAAAAGA
jgi:hypothetical protein